MIPKNSARSVVWRCSMRLKRKRCAGAWDAPSMQDIQLIDFVRLGASQAPAQRFLFNLIEQRQTTSIRIPIWLPASMRSGVAPWLARW
jgi:hypothetical protein